MLSGFSMIATSSLTVQSAFLALVIRMGPCQAPGAFGSSGSPRSR